MPFKFLMVIFSIPQTWIALALYTVLKNASDQMWKGNHVPEHIYIYMDYRVLLS